MSRGGTGVQKHALPVTPGSVLRDFVAAARLRLEHTLGRCNAAQKVFHWGVTAFIIVMTASGIAIWKPLQTYPALALFSGFHGTRLVHFLVMSGIVAFLFVHIAIVALVPSTFIAMIAGRFGREPAAHYVVPTRTGGDVP